MRPIPQSFLRAVAPVSYQATILADTPLAFWPCNDAAGSGTLADVSGNARTATLNGTRTLETARKNARLGTCINWAAGSGYASITADAWFQILGDVTFELWFKLNTAMTSGQQVRLLQVGAAGETSATNVALFFVYENSGGTLRLSAFHESGSGTDNEVNLNRTLAVSTWYHLAFTRDVTTNRYDFYVDGVLAGGNTYTNDPSGAGSAVLNLNRSAAGTTVSERANDACGYALFGSKLTPERIFEHYRAGRRAA